MERRLSYPQPEEEEGLSSTTQSDMHDFSISSLISNVSRLLEGNNSSFLVHVDSHRFSKSPTSFSSSNRKNSNEFSETGDPEISGLYAPNADVLVPSTPLHRKLGQPETQVLEANFQHTSTDSHQNRDKPNKNFSVTDLIARVEKERKSNPHVVPTPHTQDRNSKVNSENDDTEMFLLSDFIKDIKTPLPIRRFPPPMLPAIFEQSCEDMSMSRSLASSVSSCVSKKKACVPSVNIPGPVPKTSKSGDASLNFPDNSSIAKNECRTVFVKPDSKIPVPVLMHPKPQKKIFDFESSCKPFEFSSNSAFINTSQSAVLKIDEADLSKIENQASLSVSEWMNGSGIMNQVEIEYQRSDETDSWNEFDKIMDKSLPPKQWEIHEFEELATEQKNKSVLVDKDQEISFDYVSADEAKLLMDKEEEIRGQFLKSSDVSFASVGDSVGVEPAPGIDIFSMTNYFQLRSSFPIDNQANESSMFQDDYTARQEDIQASLLSDSDSVTRDVTVTPTNSNTVLEQSNLQLTSNQIQTPSVLVTLDSKTKNLARFLMGSESDGIEKNSIMEHVLEMCKRRSSYGILNSQSQTPNVIIPSEQDNKLQEQSINSSSNFQVLKSMKNNVVVEDQTIRNPDCIQPTNSKRHISKENVQSERKQPREKKSSFRAPSKPDVISKVTFSEPLPTDSNLNCNLPSKGDEIDTSIMLSEHGKAAFFDDVDTHGMEGFDEFKRYLVSGNKSKKDVVKVKTMKENIRPTGSAFIPLPNVNINTDRENKNPLRESVERLRKSAPSPPEKLVSGKVLISSTEPYQTISLNKLENQNHSTPVAAEPLSIQLAKSMTRETSYIQPLQSTRTENAGNIDSNFIHSGQSNMKNTISQPVTSTFRNSSTPNEFEQRALGSLTDTNTRKNPSHYNHDKPEQIDSLLSVEIGRNPSKQTTQNSSQDVHLKDKYSVAEKAEREPIPSTMATSLGLSSALGTHCHATHGTASSSCDHHNLPASYPTPFGFPVSIHIHLPTMPYSNQPYQYGQPSGYSLSHAQAPSSNMCNCQLSVAGNKGN